MESSPGLKGSTRISRMGSPSPSPRPIEGKAWRVYSGLTVDDEGEPAPSPSQPASGSDRIASPQHTPALEARVLLAAAASPGGSSGPFPSKEGMLEIGDLTRQMHDWKIKSK